MKCGITYAGLSFRPRKCIVKPLVLLSYSSLCRECTQVIPSYAVEECFADATYPISRVLMKPFTNNEISNDTWKLLLNRRLSGLQTVLSEYVFGRWVRRFPNIKDLNKFLTQLQKTIEKYCSANSMKVSGIKLNRTQVFSYFAKSGISRT